MQCNVVLFQLKVCEAVEKSNRDFLWGSTQEKRKLHMVKWSTVTLPKNLEGLGIMEMRPRNEKILAKLWSDFWLSFGPLRSCVQGPLTREELSLLVADIKD